MVDLLVSGTVELSDDLLAEDWVAPTVVLTVGLWACWSAPPEAAKMAAKKDFPMVQMKDENWVDVKDENWAGPKAESQDVLWDENLVVLLVVCSAASWVEEQVDLKVDRWGDQMVALKAD